MTNIVLSERQRPRALQLMKSIYANANDCSCGRGQNCPKMVELKQRIEELEQEEARSNGLSRSLQLE